MHPGRRHNTWVSLQKNNLLGQVHQTLKSQGNMSKTVNYLSLKRLKIYAYVWAHYVNNDEPAFIALFLQ